MTKVIPESVESPNRSRIWDEYNGPKTPEVRHNFVDYDRYHEARLIATELLKREINLDEISVLDYGCCAADYGIFFARRGSLVHCVDIDNNALAFAKWRFAREDMTFGEQRDYDLIIFGEVLEHLENPLEVMKKYTDTNTSFIFTSSYPMRSSNPEDSYWKGRGHTEAAREQQAKCRKLLESLYEGVNLGGEMRLWV